jgi:triosephosphate isomerase
MSRKFFVGGNWKMNGSKKIADELLGHISRGPLDPNVGKLMKIYLFVHGIHLKSFFVRDINWSASHIFGFCQRTGPLYRTCISTKLF